MPRDPREQLRTGRGNSVRLGRTFGPSRFIFLLLFHTVCPMLPRHSALASNIEDFSENREKRSYRPR